ncbi:MAG: hypothetical protein FWC41_03580 [Firmicutes bacterium]|nr:hypothetical protein [Bacillota bacterium]
METLKINIANKTESKLVELSIPVTDSNKIECETFIAEISRGEHINSKQKAVRIIFYHDYKKFISRQIASRLSFVKKEKTYIFFLSQFFGENQFLEDRLMFFIDDIDFDSIELDYLMPEMKIDILIYERPAPLF